VRTPRRLRFPWVLALAASALLSLGLWLAAVPSQAAPLRQEPAEGALEELARTRLEQSLIQAEPTARLLHLLEARGTGGP
jgi:hypothetical protein